MLPSIEYIRDKAQKIQPRVGLILGSGLNDFAEDAISDAITIPYTEVPDFPCSTASGHKGNFVIGKVGSLPVICMQGRFHLYEGYDMKDVTLPVRVMAKLGIETLIVTNASGGINAEFNPGDLMVISDHVNFMNGNPLIGKVQEGETRFPDMTEAYDAKLIELVESTAAEHDIKLQKGVYVANTGPSFETPAEIRMYDRLGIDAVGMSTVPEVIVARQLGMRVMGISLISNKAAGLSKQPLTEMEVFETAEFARETFTKLINEVLKKL